MDHCRDHSEEVLTLDRGAVSDIVVTTPLHEDVVRMTMTLIVYIGDGNCQRIMKEPVVVDGVTEVMDNAPGDPVITQIHSQMMKTQE